LTCFMEVCVVALLRDCIKAQWDNNLRTRTCVREETDFARTVVLLEKDPLLSFN